MLNGFGYWECLAHACVKWWDLSNLQTMGQGERTQSLKYGIFTCTPQSKMNCMWGIKDKSRMDEVDKLGVLYDCSIEGWAIKKQHVQK